MSSKDSKANSRIQNIHARMILDSLGNPTLEVEVTTGDGVFRAGVASESPKRLPHEPQFSRDGDSQFDGHTVYKAVNNIKNQVLHPLIGMSVLDQSALDATLQELDGTEKYEKLGANTMLGVSKACSMAAAAHMHCPLWKYIALIADTKKCTIPVPLISIIGGSTEAANPLPFNDLCVAPVGATSIYEAIKTCYDIIFDIQKSYPLRYNNANGSFNLKDMKINSVEDYLDVLSNVIKNQNLEGKVMICINCQSSKFCTKTKDLNSFKYDLTFKSQKKEAPKTSSEMVEYYIKLAQNYPIQSLQDPFDFEDEQGYIELKKKLEENQLKLTIFGDALTQSQQKLITKYGEQKLVNGVVLKLNQNGTVTQAINAYKEACAHGLKVVVQARFGEISDAYLSHFVVGLSNELFFIGGLQRAERICKYNELVRVEEGGELVYGCQDWLQQ